MDGRDLESRRRLHGADCRLHELLLAQTGAIDVWYLFPLNAVVRQLAVDFDAVDKPKQAALDQIFGTPNWRTELYKEAPAPDLFDDRQSKTTRVASQKGVRSDGILLDEHEMLERRTNGQRPLGGAR